MDWVTNSVRKIFSSKDNPEQSSTEIERENNDSLKNLNATNSTMGEATNTNHMNVCGNSNKMKSVKQSIINARGLSEDCKPKKKRKREAEDDSDCCNKKIKAPEVTQTTSSSVIPDWVKKLFGISKSDSELPNTEIERKNNDSLKNPNATNSHMAEASNTNHIDFGNSNSVQNVSQAITNSGGLPEGCKPKEKRKYDDNSDPCDKKKKAAKVTQTISSPKGSASNAITIGEKKQEHVQVKNVVASGDVTTGNECTFGNKNKFEDLKVVNCDEYVENKHMYESSGDVEDGCTDVFQNFGNASEKNEPISMENINVGNLELKPTDQPIDLGSQVYRNFLNAKTETGAIEQKNIGVGNMTLQVDPQNPQLTPKRSLKAENFLNSHSTGGKINLSGINIGCVNYTSKRQQP